MQGNDIKYALRKKEFPFSAREALSKAEELLMPNGNAQRSQMVKQTELAMELIAEFIFNEGDRKGYHRKKLSHVEELELTTVACDHLSFETRVAQRNAVALSLFPVTSPERIPRLASLISLAASTSTVSTLDAAASLLTQVGPGSEYAGNLVKHLVEGHLLLVTPQISLRLASEAPLLTANLITALTSAYNFSEKKEMWCGPPEEILDLVLGWLGIEPDVLQAPLRCPPTLPLGAITMLPLTPHAGLIRWYVVGEGEAYRKLEIEILERLEAGEGRALVTADQLLPAIHFLLSFKVCPVSALDRLATALHTASVTNTFVGPKQEVWRLLRKLPHHSLMEPLICKYPASI